MLYGLRKKFPTLSLGQPDSDLAHEMAGRQSHVCQRSRIPRGQHKAPVIGVALDGVYELRQLVHALASVVGMHV